MTDNSTITNTLTDHTKLFEKLVDNLFQNSDKDLKLNLNVSLILESWLSDTTISENKTELKFIKNFDNPIDRTLSNTLYIIENKFLLIYKYNEIVKLNICKLDENKLCQIDIDSKYCSNCGVFNEFFESCPHLIAFYLYYHNQHLLSEFVNTVPISDINEWIRINDLIYKS